MIEKKEYIEREAVLRNLADDLPYKGSVKRVIMQAPAADVVEVKHGEWVHNRDTGDERCTVCGFEWWDSCQECGVRPSNTKYCPNCGAKMDGERKERG